MASPSLIAGVSAAAAFGVLILGFLVAFCCHNYKTKQKSNQTPIKRMKTDTKSIKKKADQLKAPKSKQKVCCALCRFSPRHRILLPDPPQGLSVRENGPQCVLVQWNEPEVRDDVSNILYFLVYKRLSKSVNDWIKCAKTKQGLKECFIKALKPETRYVFGVASVNKGGTSAIVESDPIVVKGKDVTPGAPTAVRVKEKDKNTVKLAWKPPKKPTSSRVTAYHVMIQDGIWIDLATLTVLDRCMEHKIIDLFLHTPYRFRVAAENEFGRGPFVETETVILTGGPDPPGKPRGPLMYSKVTHHSVTMSWKPPSYPGCKPLTGFGIEIYDPRKGVWQKCHACAVNVLSFTATKLSENISYRFRVAAMNDIGNGAPLVGKKIKTKLLEIPLAQRSAYSRMATSRSSSRSKGTGRLYSNTPGRSSGNDVILDIDTGSINAASIKTGSTGLIGLKILGSSKGSLNGSLDSKSIDTRGFMETRESGVQTERGPSLKSGTSTETTFDTESDFASYPPGSRTTKSAEQPYKTAFSMYNREHLHHLQRSINDKEIQAQSVIQSQ